MSEVDAPKPHASALHEPVMVDRIVQVLAPALQAPGSVHVDGTLGMGGHAEAILAACPHARLIGIDRDPQALAIAGERLARFGDRVRLERAVYDELPQVLERTGTTSIQSMLLDLGLSSLQIDRTERGFAYSVDAPLDMRMGDSGPTAADVVNTYELDDLERILRRFGEEKFSRRIAQRIVAARQQEPFTSSARLVQVISDAIPAAARNTGGHPAKRTFQALRIEVNAELEALAGVLPAAVAALAVGGRLAVLAYHSLEDRLVKQVFRVATSDRAPAHLPMVPEHLRAECRSLTRGAEKPTPDEVAANRRAASARFRAIERVRAIETVRSAA
ncbi:16S rRNA (cytosine(1402)-N(4))-methyltransferase RsmH [Aestuariimicrobium kwangyangense]|uniref:16S rRNA (cytosine(1402)-N(4))-methyltransferase RsmH n=1 Tax=Aestuariimicrobium kwangyangense TaxID=396389 RepID=UPI0003B34A35|nr:16S rRNA (cytosine(1402)-N(4))-methyltransferase RsmH [Aestuariimicrobium kwangyangense]